MIGCFDARKACQPEYQGMIITQTTSGINTMCACDDNRHVLYSTRDGLVALLDIESVPLAALTHRAKSSDSFSQTVEFTRAERLPVASPPSLNHRSPPWAPPPRPSPPASSTPPLTASPCLTSARARPSPPSSWRPHWVLCHLLCSVLPFRSLHSQTAATACWWPARPAVISLSTTCTTRCW